jgi:hypothetical protein
MLQFLPEEVQLKLATLHTRMDGEAIDHNSRYKTQGTENGYTQGQKELLQILFFMSGR